jgi:hypothetical protein
MSKIGLHERTKALILSGILNLMLFYKAKDYLLFKTDYSHLPAFQYVAMAWL